MNGKLLLKHIAKWRVLYVVTLLASLSFFGVNAFDTYTPTVISDKDDYAPGEVAIISGYGWTKDTLVDIHLEEDPVHDHHHGYHDTKVNPDGSWQIEYPIEDRHLGVKFTVIVVGKQTGHEERAYFTDAPSITSVTPNSGPTLGNTEVTITGRGLFVNNWDLAIKFGNLTAIEKTNSRTTSGQGANQLHSVIVYAPAQAVGVYDIKAVMTRTTGQQTQVEESNAVPYNYIKSAATLSLSNLSHIFDGSSKSATVTTNPAGLTGVKVTYNGSPTAPTTAGTYEVVAMLENPDYEAESVTGSLVIEKAMANITLSDLVHTYTGSPKSATATTEATGTSSFTFTYDGIAAQPVNYKAGGYEVVATLNNDNYSGSATGTLIINKANQAITWNKPNTITYGTALSGTQLNAVLSTGDGVLTYSPAVGTLLNAGGEQTLSVSAAETNNYNAATATVLIDVLKATPTVSLTVGGPYTYDGEAKSVTSATVAGVGGDELGAATVTYQKGGVDVSPVNTGEYTVVASFAGDNNYEPAQETGTLVINKAMTSISISNVSGKVYNGSTHTITAETSPKGLSGISVQYSKNSLNILASEVVNAGSYGYYVSLDNDNYEAEPISGNFVIAPKGLTAALANSGKVYDGTTAAPGTTATLDGVIGNDDVTAEVTGAAFNSANAGQRSVSADVALVGDDSGNYKLTNVTNASATISQKGVTASISASDKIYDGTTAASATGNVPAGIVSGDEVNVTVSNAKFADKNVGTGKTVTADVAIDNNNYSLTSASASTTASITPKSITITAPSMSKYCGQANPMSGYYCEVDGAVNNEKLVTSYIFDGTTVEPVCTDAQLSNYTPSYVNGTLTINGVTMDVSNASVPRSIYEEVVIKMHVKDGNSNIEGVSVKLFYNNQESAYVVSDANGIATFSLGKLPVNVYAVTAQAGDGCSETQVAYMPVYDPDGGFVTGGGWINSPQYTPYAYMQVAGKANFGFNAKYKKGKNEVNEVDGNTTFHLNAGNLDFKSSSHTAMSLVIANHKATYTGEGTINGNGGYAFRVIAVDGDVKGNGNPDHFRIKIWVKSSGQVVYDNQFGVGENEEPSGDNTILGGGSIVIHEVKAVTTGPKNSKVVSEELMAEPASRFDNYPNAFSDRTTIRFAFEHEQRYTLEVYDIRGALVKRVATGNAEAGQVYEYELDARNLAEGVYFAKLATGSKVQTIKMLLKK